MLALLTRAACLFRFSTNLPPAKVGKQYRLPLRAGSLLRQSFQPLLTKASIPHIRFHDLRHSTATLLLTLGVYPKVVQELLGHSQIFVTLDIYSHILPTLQEEAMDHLNQFLTSSEPEKCTQREVATPQA